MGRNVVTANEMLSEGLRDAADPRARASVLLWRLLAARHREVSIRVRENRLEVRDEQTGETLGPASRFNSPHTADPAAFDNPFVVLQAVRNQAGWLRSRPMRKVPMSASPPRINAMATFTDVSETEVRLHVDYDVGDGEWRMRRRLWEAGNRLFNRA